MKPKLHGVDLTAWQPVTMAATCFSTRERCGNAIKRTTVAFFVRLFQRQLLFFSLVLVHEAS